MEAKQFMVGDLVYRKEHNEFRKPVPRSVVKIDGVEDNDMITIAPDSEFLNMDEIEPISWTAEIAVKNGFEFEGGEYWLRCGALTIRTGNGYVAIVETFKNGVTQERIHIRKICFHELQHALRLVGLNEVADNLKV